MSFAAYESFALFIFVLVLVLILVLIFLLLFFLFVAANTGQDLCFGVRIDVEVHVLDDARNEIVVHNCFEVVFGLFCLRFGLRLVAQFKCFTKHLFFIFVIVVVIFHLGIGDFGDWLNFRFCFLVFINSDPISLFFQGHTNRIGQFRLHVRVNASIHTEITTCLTSCSTRSSTSSHVDVLCATAKCIFGHKDRACDEHICDHAHAHRNIHEVTVVTVVGSFNQCLQLRDIVCVGKVDDVNRNIVSLKSFTQVNKLRCLFFDRVANEDDNSLALTFVNAMFE